MQVNIPPYLKAWVAGTFAVLTAIMVVIEQIQEAIADNIVTFDEVGILIPIIAAQIALVFGVFQAENKPLE